MKKFKGLAEYSEKATDRNWDSDPRLVAREVNSSNSGGVIIDRYQDPDQIIATQDMPCSKPSKMQTFKLQQAQKLNPFANSSHSLVGSISSFNSEPNQSFNPQSISQNKHHSETNLLEQNQQQWYQENQNKDHNQIFKGVFANNPNDRKFQFKSDHLKDKDIHAEISPIKRSSLMLKKSRVDFTPPHQELKSIKNQKTDSGRIDVDHFLINERDFEHDFETMQVEHILSCQAFVLESMSHRVCDISKRKISQTAGEVPPNRHSRNPSLNSEISLKDSAPFKIQKIPNPSPTLHESPTKPFSNIKKNISEHEVTEPKDSSLIKLEKEESSISYINFGEESDLNNEHYFGQNAIETKFHSESNAHFLNQKSSSIKSMEKISLNGHNPKLTHSKHQSPDGFKKIEPIPEMEESQNQISSSNRLHKIKPVTKYIKESITLVENSSSRSRLQLPEPKTLQKHDKNTLFLVEKARLANSRQAVENQHHDHTIYRYKFQQKDTIDGKSFIYKDRSLQHIEKSKLIQNNKKKHRKLKVTMVDHKSGQQNLKSFFSDQLIRETNQQTEQIPKSTSYILTKVPLEASFNQSKTNQKSPLANSLRKQPNCHIKFTYELQPSSLKVAPIDACCRKKYSPTKSPFQNQERPKALSARYDLKSPIVKQFQRQLHNSHYLIKEKNRDNSRLQSSHELIESKSQSRSRSKSTSAKKLSKYNDNLGQLKKERKEKGIVSPKIFENKNQSPGSVDRGCIFESHQKHTFQKKYDHQKPKFGFGLYVPKRENEQSMKNKLRLTEFGRTNTFLKE